MIDSNQIDRKFAVNVFLHLVAKHAYNAVIKSKISILENGPLGRRTNNEQTALHKWYVNLGEQDRRNVITILQDAVGMAVFSTLVVLDNKTVGYPINEQVSDFALYLQTYENVNDLKSGSPKISVRLNNSTDLEDMHDEFGFLIRENT